MLASAAIRKYSNVATGSYSMTCNCAQKRVSLRSGLRSPPPTICLPARYACPGRGCAAPGTRLPLLAQQPSLECRLGVAHVRPGDQLAQLALSGLTVGAFDVPTSELLKANRVSAVRVLAASRSG